MLNVANNIVICAKLTSRECQSAVFPFTGDRGGLGVVQQEHLILYICAVDFLAMLIEVLLYLLLAVV